MLVSYNWLKDYLGEDLPSVDEVVELLTFHAFEIEGTEKVGGDTQIEVNVLPDRASSCLSHRGIALELAVLLNKPLVVDQLKDETELPVLDDFKIEIEDKADCSRFMLALMEGVKVGPSPKWLKERLETLGQRSINNIVDATNYVMFGLGQPMHVYDSDTFSKKDDKWNFVIRRAKAGEIVKLLPEKTGAEDREVDLKGTELLVVNGESDQAVALAGIKGGTYAGLHEGTTNIILEAANFNSTLTRKTARALGILTDASKRFENEVSSTLPPYAMRTIVELITEIASGELKGVSDQYPMVQAESVVTVHPDRVNKVLGLSLEESFMKDVLFRLGAEISESESGWLVTAPKERVDLTIEENYIDEIGRIYGLSNIVSITPENLPLAEINANHYYSEKIRKILGELGFSEVMTSSFRKKDQIHLQNALASDKEYLRSSIIPAIEEALALNIQNVDILGLRDVRMFEIGTVFTKDDKGKAREHVVLTIGARVKKTGYSAKDDVIVNEAIKALIEAGLEIGVGAKQGICETNLDKLISALPEPTKYEPNVPLSDITYKPFSVYPAIVRDIAMWVPENTDIDSIGRILKDGAGELCERITLFDEFAKDGRISYAFRLVFQSYEKTLTDDEVEPYMAAVYRAVEKAGFDTR
ncbi:MAG: phenylalanine--tRNA ligase subunit beta [Candidatus Nomurabacteria bacterium]|nr:MAG: phenylalanine--tRNA ligase subunit beta [Candidatus Nomurabacteria bacterium]